MKRLVLFVTMSREIAKRIKIMLEGFNITEYNSYLGDIRVESELVTEIESDRDRRVEYREFYVVADVPRNFVWSSAYKLRKYRKGLVSWLNLVERESDDKRKL